MSNVINLGINITNGLSVSGYNVVPTEYCEATELALVDEGEGQTTTLVDGTSLRVVSLGTTNTVSSAWGPNTEFKSNADPVVCVGEVLVLKAAVTLGEVDDSEVYFDVVLYDATNDRDVAYVRVGYSLPEETLLTNVLVDDFADDAYNVLASDQDFSRGYRIALYLDAVEGKVFAGTSADDLYELTLQNAIDPDADVAAFVRASAGSIEDTQLLVKINAGDRKFVVNAIPSTVAWCEAVYETEE
jgi:hypothetical protein